MINVLVTGGKGQLGQAIKSIGNDYEDQIAFTYCSSSELDITNLDLVLDYMSLNSFDYCINCAAYTHVDKAEEELEQAFEINGHGVENLAVACKTSNVILIHISTDFVFSGKQSYPYEETDIAEPLSVYGKSKLQGEMNIKKHLTKFYILRTSWLYSEFGANFMKSMLRLGTEREALSIVFDQIGSPTYAVDLSKLVLHLVQNGSAHYGIYHYSNEGVASWYDFARAIFQKSGVTIDLKPIRSSEYPLPAKRPNYSVLDKGKLKRNFNITIPHWEDSLEIALSKNNLLNKLQEY